MKLMLFFIAGSKKIYEEFIERNELDTDEFKDQVTYIATLKQAKEILESADPAKDAYILITLSDWVKQSWGEKVIQMFRDKGFITL